jgi:UDP-3-O-[3-hydroxymyristoyl] N-acetylglucosamine deacetylase
VASFCPATDDFTTALAPARTWGTFEDLSALQNAGLLEGGTEQNAVVIYPDRVSEEGPWPNAFARHKLLDLFGDLYLLGAPVIGRITVARTGHGDNLALARRIAEQ